MLYAMITLKCTSFFIGILMSHIIPKSLCEIPQIANPPPSDPKDIPLYGVEGLPLETDVRQHITPDCFLEASLGAIVRINSRTITDTLQDNGDGTVDVLYYDLNSTQVSKTAQKKDFKDKLLTQDSMSCWVAVFQDTYQQLLTDQSSPDNVYNDYGGAASSFLEAIYGRSASLGNCDSIFRVGVNAGSNPTTLVTNDLEGPLVTNHAYTIHVANVSHITLRNPWGHTIAGGEDTEDLGNGTFRIAIASAQLQCAQLQYLKLS